MINDFFENPIHATTIQDFEYNTIAYCEPDKGGKVFRNTKHILFLEGHASNNPATHRKYTEMLEKYFREIKIIGYSTDNPKGIKRVLIKAVK